MKTDKIVLINIVVWCLVIVVAIAFALNMKSPSETCIEYIRLYAEEYENKEAVSPLEYPGFKYLSEHENSEKLLGAYNAIAKGVQTCEPEIQIYSTRWSLSAEEMMKVCYCYAMDYPQTFWVDNSFEIYMKGDYVWSIRYDYLFSNEELPAARKKFDETVSQILQSIKGLSDEEKERFVHDYIIQNVTYSDSLTSIDHTAYGALINKTAACDGQSEIFQHIMREAGIPCFAVYGFVGELGHAWNIIQIDGDFYNVDITWDNADSKNTGAMSYNYFNITTEQISTTHTYSQDAYEYPLCDTIWHSE